MDLGIILTPLMTGSDYVPGKFFVELCRVKSKAKESVAIFYLSFSLLKSLVGHWPPPICVTSLIYGLHHREE